MTTAAKANKQEKPFIPVFRQVRCVPLDYDHEVTHQLPEPCTFLGVHAQVEGGSDVEGRPLRKYARTVEPQLYYLFEADKPLQDVTILLLRGQAELPLDPDKEYEPIGMTIDRNPRHSGYASAWLVTKRRE